MKLTRKQAFELSIEKWRLIVENEGEEPDEFPESITKLIACCGLCEKYYFNGCKNCPLNLLNMNYVGLFANGCRETYHPFLAWHYDPSKSNAQAVLDLILSKQ